MSNVPTNLIPTKITGLPEYTGSSTLGYMPYVLEGRTYKVQFANIAAVGAVPSTREINTGTGLGGGGDLSANRTLYILPAGVDDSRLTVTGVTAGTYGAADSVPVFNVNAQGRVTSVTNTPIVLSNYVPTSRTITAGAGLTGGGALSSNLTFAVNFSSTTPEPLGVGSSGVSTVAARGDHVHPAVDLSDTTETQGVLPLSRGGTGNSLSPVVGAVAYSSNDKLYLTPTSGAAGQVLTSIGGTGAPIWTTLTGTGTVTGVSVVTANGFAGTVANPSTLPAITLSTTVSGLLKGDGTAISAATAGTDYVAPGAITTSGLTMATSRLLGRTSALTGAVEQITVGTGLSLSGGSLTNSAPDQTVSLTGAGGTTISGTYPNFTITSLAGTVTSVNGSGGTTGLTLTGGPITSTGTLTLGGTLAIANGGTGATSAASALTNLGAYPASNPNGYTSNTGTVTSVSGTGTVNGITLTGSVTTTGSLTLGGALSGVSLTSQVSGTLPIANGGTNATSAAAARTSLGAAASGANTDITSIALTTGTITTAPTAGTDIANKTYVDSISAGINFHQAVRLASTAALAAYTYNNGSSGVGATITANANGALSLDGVAVASTNRVLIKDEAGGNAAYNGVYTVTQTGSGAAPFILTRATDYNTAGTGVNQIDQGDFFLVTAGSTQANTSWVQQTPLPITVGVTALTFTQFAAPIVYSAGTGLTLAGTVFSITNTGVTANTYGSASTVPVLAINAQGQVTSASSSSIAIAGSQITSGSVAVAQGGTGATTAAAARTNLGATTVGSNFFTLTNPSAITFIRVNADNTVSTLDAATFRTAIGAGTGAGSVTSVDVSGGSTGLTATGGPITTSGTITLGGTLAAANGGTGQSSYTVGDILYASGTTALAKLADVATGNALISGGVGVAPSYGKIGLTTHVSGTLAVGNGGTGATTLTANGVLLGNGTSAISATAVGTTGQVLVGNTGAAPTWATLSSSAVTSFSAGTTGLTPSSATTGAITLAGTLNVANGGTGATSFTAGYHLKGNGTSAVSSSVIYDDGTNVGVGTASPTVLLDVFSATAANFSVRGDSATNITAHRSSTDASGPNAVLRKSRGTSASQTAVASGDTMGTLFFSAYGGANNRNIASIAGTVDTYYSDTGIGSYLTFSTTPNGSVTLAERMRIDNAGNVGIGTTSPSNKLDVFGTSSTTMRSYSTGTASSTYAAVHAGTGEGVNSVMYSYQSAGWYGLTTNHPMLFMTNNSERMRIDASGNVGIGSSSPTAKVQVFSDGPPAASGNMTNGLAVASAAGSFAINIGANATGGYTWLNSAYINASGTASPMVFMTGATERMRIDSSGNVGIGTSSPGVKLDVAGDIRSTSGNYYAANGGVYGWGSLATYVGGSSATNIITFQTNSSERMRIDSSGNVGIGTTSPGALLQLNKASGAADLRFSVAGTLYGNMYASSSDMDIYSITAIPLILGTNNTERMRISSAGNVGIGTSSPNYKLDVTGQTLIGNGVAQASPSTTDIGSTSNVIIGGQGGNALYFGQYGSGSGFAQWIQSSYLNPTTAKYNLILQPLGGAVGIGLSTPNATLHLQGIQGGNGRMTQMSTGGTSQTNLNLIASSNGGGSDQWYSYGVSSSNYYYIQTGVGAGDSGLVINSNNRVIVGTSTTFDTTVGANFMAYGSAGSAAAFKVNATASTQVSFYDSTQSARVGWIGTSGSSTSYNTTSDRRLKKNIQPVGDVGDKIDQIEVVSHEWTNGTDTVIPYAFIAQDLYEAAPHAVSKGDDGDEVVTEWAVDYSKLVPMMIKEMQSMRARIAELEGK